MKGIRKGNWQRNLLENPGGEKVTNGSEKGYPPRKKGNVKGNLRLRITGRRSHPLVSKTKYKTYRGVLFLLKSLVSTW